jgi:hypothetical protein
MSSLHCQTFNVQLKYLDSSTICQCQLRNSQTNSLLQMPTISLPSLLSHLRLPSQETPSFLTLVRVRLTLRLAPYRQSVHLGDKPLKAHDQYFFPTEHLLLQSFCNILSDERMVLSFTIASGPRERIHSRVKVPRVS